VTMMIRDGTMFLGTWGEIRALDATTLTEKWQNKMKGCGHGYAHTLAYHKSGSKSLLITGMNGYIFAADAHTGEKVWKISLPGSGFQMICILKVNENGILYVGTNGFFFGVKLEDGEIVFKVFVLRCFFFHQLFQSVFVCCLFFRVIEIRSEFFLVQDTLAGKGYGIVMMATVNTCLDTASHCTVLHGAEVKKEEAARAAAGA